MKKLRFEVILSVDEVVPDEEAERILKEMLSDMEQARNYEDVLVVDGVEMRDDVAERLLETVTNLPDGEVERAVKFVEGLEDE